MNKHNSAARRRGILRRFTRSTGGTAAVVHDHQQRDLRCAPMTTNETA